MLDDADMEIDTEAEDIDSDEDGESGHVARDRVITVMGKCEEGSAIAPRTAVHATLACLVPHLPWIVEPVFAMAIFGNLGDGADPADVSAALRTWVAWNSSERDPRAAAAILSAAGTIAAMPHGSSVRGATLFALAQHITRRTDLTKVAAVVGRRGEAEREAPGTDISVTVAGRSPRIARFAALTMAILAGGGSETPNPCRGCASAIVGMASDGRSAADIVARFSGLVPDDPARACAAEWMAEGLYSSSDEAFGAVAILAASQLTDAPSATATAALRRRYALVRDALSAAQAKNDALSARLAALGVRHERGYDSVEGANAPHAERDAEAALARFAAALAERDDDGDEDDEVEFRGSDREESQGDDRLESMNRAIGVVVSDARGVGGIPAACARRAAGAVTALGDGDPTDIAQSTLRLLESVAEAWRIATESGAPRSSRIRRTGALAGAAVRFAKLVSEEISSRSDSDRRYRDIGRRYSKRIRSMLTLLSGMADHDEY